MQGTISCSSHMKRVTVNNFREKFVEQLKFGFESVHKLFKSCDLILLLVLLFTSKFKSHPIHVLENKVTAVIGEILILNAGNCIPNSKLIDLNEFSLYCVCFRFLIHAALRALWL